MFCKNLTDAWKNIFKKRIGKRLCSTFEAITREKILNNTEISNSHLTPEISLRLITTNCKIYNQPIIKNEDKIFENDPFWGIYWPGGQALSRYILDYPSVVKSKTVIDIGSGSGACSIASYFAEAYKVTSNDIDTVAVIAAKMNAELNNTKIFTSNKNLIGQPLSENVILLGDIFYDEEITEKLIPWLFSFKNKNKTILIGDPGRHPLTQNRIKYMKKLKTYDLPSQCQEENYGFQKASIWEWIGNP